MSLLDSIKAEVKKSGSSKGKFLFVRSGQKVRIRFLTDMEDGIAVNWHDSFTKGINVPCQEQYGRECPYCEDEELRHKIMYAWPVYNYDSKQVQIFMFAVNNCSPVPALLALYDTYGTITDRDYVISVQGQGTTKAYSVVPMDKVKFRNEKAKPLSEKRMMEEIDKAYPADLESEDFEESKKSKKSKKKATEDNEDEDWDEEEQEENSYEDMSPKELYKLCKEREIECKPKKNSQYYITLLEEYDEALDDWSDGEEEEDEEDWDEE